jgi:hypothetical protein
VNDYYLRARVVKRTVRPGETNESPRGVAAGGMAKEGAQRADQITFDEIDRLAGALGEEFAVQTSSAGDQGFDPSEFEGFGPAPVSDTQNILDEGEQAPEDVPEEIEEEEEHEDPPEEPEDEGGKDSTEDEDDPPLEGETWLQRKPQEDDDDGADVRSASGGLSGVKLSHAHLA